MRLIVESDGSPEGTHLVDADTLTRVVLEGAHVRCDLDGGPGTSGKAHVVLVLPDLPVRTGSTAAFHLRGASPGGTALGAAPASVQALTAPPSPAARPVSTAPSSEEGHREFNRRMNENVPGRGPGPRS